MFKTRNDVAVDQPNKGINLAKGGWNIILVPSTSLVTRYVESPRSVIWLSQSRAEGCPPAHIAHRVTGRRGMWRISPFVGVLSATITWPPVSGEDLTRRCTNVWNTTRGDMNYSEHCDVCGAVAGNYGVCLVNQILFGNSFIAQGVQCLFLLSNLVLLVSKYGSMVWWAGVG